MDGAERSLDVASPDLGATGVLAALHDADRRGVRVRLLTGLDRRAETAAKLRSWHLSSLTSGRRWEGAPNSRSYVVRDGIDVWCGPASFTYEALHEQGDECLVLRGRRIAAQFAEAFEGRHEIPTACCRPPNPPAGSREAVDIQSRDASVALQTRGVEMDYHDFDVEVGAAAEGMYSVRVRSSEGEAPGSMRPLDEGKLKDQLQSLQRAVLASGGAAAMDARDELAVRALGKDLWDALFDGPILSRFDATRQRAQNRGAPGVRVKLNVSSPDLATLPWEFLFDEGHGDYLLLQGGNSLIRVSAAHAGPRSSRCPWPTEHPGSRRQHR